MLAQSCKRFPERDALFFKGRTWDYQSLLADVNRFASGLSALGIGKGDRVAIMLPNCPQYVIAYYGILTAGGIVVQVNPMSIANELDHYLGDSAAKAIIVYDQFLPQVEQIRSGSETLKKIAVAFQPASSPYPEGTILFESLIASGQQDAPEVQQTADDVAVLQYTGGTTGRSKGAMLTHRNLMANAYQVFIMFGGEQQEQDRILNALPLFHVYGMTVGMNAAILGGSQMIILPRFDLKETLETIRETRPTIFPGAPTMYVAINSHPQVEEYGISSIRLCVSGSAPLPVEVIKEFEAKTRGTILEGYGLTEAAPATHFNPMDKRKPGSIGKPLLSTEAKVVDLHEGLTEVPPGEAGELIVRGPQVMLGYWNMTQETEMTIRNGWLYTGDIARVDDEGYFYIVDRKKDMIIASGYNVYPREVEEVLYQHPFIQEAVVIGIPDSYRGETVKALVVTREGSTLTEEEVITYCRQQMASYKVPRSVEFRTSLPKTAVGKILRRTLRDEVLQQNTGS
ncbi:long-chain fatty acid--CoA ligase [Brevibacillus humidisoli]|uniref:long-chain-fatty-acid--CoA ligase n=1 Tax=Brevibacillus humidisoli TaxID=2895522 RepID=UPI001E3232E3|nr:long-chain fatty acid--CoA ligase [Brevibacillus humidisoli]